MQIIPLQPNANQTFGVVLGGQACEINLVQKTTGLFATLWVNNTVIVSYRLARHGVPIVRQSYLGFIGDLVILDSQGSDDPIYTGLGSRWNLYYVTGNDL